jgi:hypothetical protein
MSYNYTQFISEVANLAGTTVTQPNFVTELPNAIDYGEQRIFRDLDLIATVATDASQACSPNNRYINIPGTFVVVKGVNVITPAGATPATGKRNPLVRASLDLLDFLFPDSSVVGVPTRFHVQTQGFGSNAGTLVVGQWPDQGYAVEYVGTQRPAPLSSGNPNTFLATNLPDIFLIACMIHMSAYQKNWSALGNDPASGQTYEAQYQKLLLGADAEELRKRYEGSSAFPPWGMDKQPTSPDAKA